MSKNDITGDSIRSKPLSKEAEDNWDKIFGKKEKFNRRNIKPEIFTIPKEKHIHTMLPEYELNKSSGEVEKRFKDGTSKPNGEQFNDE